MSYHGLKPGTNYPEVSYNNLVDLPSSQKVVYTGNGVDDTYTLPVEPGVAENLQVTIDGVTQQPGIDYVLASATEIQFTTPLDQDMEAVVVYRGFALGVNSSPLATEADPYLNADLNVNGYSIRSLNNGDVNIFAHGIGNVKIEDIAFPKTDGVYGQVLATDGGGNLYWANAGAGATYTFANLGTGEGVFAQNNAGSLEFKSLAGGYGITLSSTGTEITIAIDPETITIEDLVDVDTNGAVPGSVIKWNGTEWVISTDLTGTSGGLASSTTDDLAEGTSNLYYRDTRVDTRIAATNIGQLANVASTAPTSGQALIWNGSTWAPGNVAGGIIDADTLDGFDSTYFLNYNNLNNKPTIPSDVSDLTDNGALLVHFSGNYNDLTNKPTIPTDLTDLGISDGTTGQILSTDGAGNFTFITVSGAGPETDPVFTASPAGGITTQNITNWNTAYGWGNHATAGYLTSIPANYMQEGENISLLNNDSGYITGIGTFSINALVDVDTTTTTPNTGDVLKWDGANWAPAVDNTGGGAGSGTVNTGTAQQITYYASTGSAVSGATNLTWNSATNTLTTINISATDITATGDVTADSFVSTGVGVPTITSATDIILNPTGDVQLSNKKIVNLATPTANSDAATKLYVDNAVAGAGGGGISLTDLSVTQNTASGSGTLTYNNTSGVFTYTPPDLSGYIAQQDAIQTETISAHTGDTITFKNRFNLDSVIFDVTSNSVSIGGGTLNTNYELKAQGDVLWAAGNQFGSHYNSDRYGTLTPVGPAQPHGKHYGPITANGVGAYTFSGLGDNPTLTLWRGETYAFQLNASGHPFVIKTVAGSGTGNIYNEGTTNQGIEQGYMYFTVPLDAPDTLYYQCTAHAPMVGTINVTDRHNRHITGGGLVTGFTSGFANADTNRWYWNLPEAGDYMLYSVLRTYLWGATGFIKCRLYDNTAGAAIANSDRMLFEAQSVTMAFNVMSTPVWKVSVTQPSTIYLQLEGTTANAGIQDDTNGWNEQGWIRIH